MRRIENRCKRHDEPLEFVRLIPHGARFRCPVKQCRHRVDYPLSFLAGYLPQGALDKLARQHEEG